MQLKSSRGLTSVFLLIQLLSACKDDPTQIGTGVLPASDRLSVLYFEGGADSSSLYKLSEAASTSDIVFLGTLNDPIFGQMSCQLLNEITPMRSFYYDNKPRIADSLILRLRYSSLTGNPNVKIKFSVYKLLDTLNIFKVYSSNLDLNSFVNFSYPIGHAILNPKDTAISIRLSNDFMQEIASLDSATLNTDSLFRKQKLGIYIRVDITDATGAIVSFNLRESEILNPTNYYYANNLIFFYHTPNNSSAIEFNMISNSATSSGSYIYDHGKANIFQHNYATAKFINELNGGIKDTSTLYTLGAGGIKSALDFSSLSKLTNGHHVAVSKAELDIPYYSNKSLGSYVMQDSSLSLYLINAKTSNVAYYDTTLIPKNGNYENGVMDTINGYFKVNITQFVQNLIEHQLDSTKKDYSKIIIAPRYSSGAMKGAILKRGKNIKVKIKYTKF